VSISRIVDSLAIGSVGLARSVPEDGADQRPLSTLSLYRFQDRYSGQ
jgi:hypothetical protein